jgi:hypothetical protein
MKLAACCCTKRYSVFSSGRWQSQPTGAPSGARWGCQPMACTRGFRSGDPARSQALRRASIALSVACRWVPLRCGAAFGVRGACATDRFGATSSGQWVSLPVPSRLQLPPICPSRPCRRHYPSANITTPAAIAAAPPRRNQRSASPSSVPPASAANSIETSRAGATWLKGASCTAYSTIT